MSVDDDQPEVLFRAKLQRDTGDTPWGFRLQGGVEFDTPLTLLKVMPDSVASRCGLNAGDIVVRLSGQSASAMTHLMAQQAIASSGNTLEIIVQRAEVTLPSQQSAADLFVDDGSILAGLKVPASTTSNNVSRLRSDVRITSSAVDVGSHDVIIGTSAVTRKPKRSTIGGDVIVSGVNRKSTSGGVATSVNGDVVGRLRDETISGPPTTGRSNGNIPQSTHLHPVQALVSTDALSRDYGAHVTSGSDCSSSDTVSDCASEISDEVASVIEMPVSSSVATASSGDVITADDVGHLDDDDDDDGVDVGYDDTESGICPDYDSSFDESVGSPSSRSSVDYIQSFPADRFKSRRRGDNDDDRSPTPTGNDVAATAAPTSVVGVESTRRQRLITRSSENWTGSANSIAIGSSANTVQNLQTLGADVVGARRDFSQTAPWRVSGHQQRATAMSAAASVVGASMSDPDIASSSAAADRMAVAAAASAHQDSTVAAMRNRRLRAELEMPRARPMPNEILLNSRGDDRASSSNVVRIPISFTSSAAIIGSSVDSKPAPSSRSSASSSSSSSSSVSAAASLTSAAVGRSSSSSDMPSPSLTNSLDRTLTSSSSKNGTTVTTTTAASGPPRCYIPQKPPPIPMPGSVGPDPRSTLRTVRQPSTTSSEETPASAAAVATAAERFDQPSARRRNDDDVIDRRSAAGARCKDDPAVAAPAPPSLSSSVDDAADMPARPVREMVAELNSRLERCEQSTDESPYGSRYDLREAEAARRRRRSSSGSDSEREIFIDTPPAAAVTSGYNDDEISPLTAPRQRTIITPTVSYHGTIVYAGTPVDLLHLSPRSARRFSLPASSTTTPQPSVVFNHVIDGTDAGYPPNQHQQQQQRKVRFAEPPESSVIEIESSRRRRRQTAAAAAADFVVVPDGSGGTTVAVAADDWRRAARSRNWPTTSPSTSSSSSSSSSTGRWYQQRLSRATAGSSEEDADFNDDDDDATARDWTTPAAGTTDAEYGSVTSLSEKLDRIELEHALASAAMRRSRPFQQQQQQQSRAQMVGGMPWNQSSTDSNLLAHQQQQQQPSQATSAKLEPINERIISIQPPSPASSAAGATAASEGGINYMPIYYDNEYGSRPAVGGGLRYMFRRRSNADVIARQQTSNRPGAAGFSVSIEPSVGGSHGGGGRLSLFVRPSAPGTRVNVVMPSAGTTSNSTGGAGGISYSISSSSTPIGRSLSPYALPPSYEESVRGGPQQLHQRSPSLQDFGAAAASSVFTGGVAQPSRFQQQQQLIVPMMTNNVGGRSAPSSPSSGYSQTLQVDTGLRNYQAASPTGSPRPQQQLLPSSSSQANSAPLPSGSAGMYTVYRAPSPVGRYPFGDRQARLEQVRARPQSGDGLDVPKAAADGRSSSPLILAPTGSSGRHGPPMPSMIADRQQWGPDSGGYLTSVGVTERNATSPLFTMTPVTPQMAAAQSALESLTNSTGILAFLDQTFTDKILNWQAQRARGEDPDAAIRNSDTYRLVRELDKQQQRRPDHH